MMTITIQWDNPKHSVIRMEFEDGWTLRDLHRAVRESNAITGKEKRAIDMILVWKSQSPVPPNAIRYIKNLISRGKNRSGINIFVGTGAIFESFWQLFTSRRYDMFVRDHEIVFVETIEEARKILAREHMERTNPVW
jgi:hypothetical protein